MKFFSSRVCLRLLVATFLTGTLHALAVPILGESEDLVQNDSSNNTIPTISPSEASYLQELGLNEELLEELKTNLNKAIAQAKLNDSSRLRQDGVGEYFGLGNGGAGGGGGGGGQGGSSFGGGFGQEEDDEDEETVSAAPGPGALGILSGLYGLFSGVGSLNPQRVLAATVNFFPPDRRAEAQMALGNIFGTGENVTTALPPLTDAPPAANKLGTVSLTTLKPAIAKTSVTERTKVRTRSRSTTAPPKKKVPVGSEKVEGTSLEEDFAEAVETAKPSSLETEFGNTADIFKLPEKTTLKPNAEPSFIEKEFAEAGMKLKFKTNL